ncbi:MAG TPA: hypothetical protein VD788_15750 [Candidatus Polarisedimenticolaceae bacterium]|nr:hypothetical protein [Candidatus Polarisedimenticolaceae bacterium]
MTHDQKTSTAHGWRNRPLVRETDARRLFSLWKTLLVAVVALAPGAAYVVQQSQCLKLSYQVADLEVTHEQLVKQELELLAQAETLEELDDIERWALGRRGLDRPAAEDVVIVRIDRSRPSALLARRSSDTTDDIPR